MDKPSNSLTKNCSICGLSKPLSDFSQLAGLGGTVIYGTICEDCRKENIERLAGNEGEGGITSGTKKTLDTKAKVKMEIDKKELKKTIEEGHEKEREKEAQRSYDKSEKIVKSTKEQKRHRESILAKSSVLSIPRNLDKVNAQKEAHSTPHSESSTKEISEQLERTGEIDQQLKTINTQTPFMPSQTGGQAKFQSAVYRQFIDWLGNNSPAARAAKSAEGKKQLAEHTEKETIVEYIRKAWKK